MLRNECFPVFQDLLLFWIENTKSIGVPAAGLLSQFIFNILNRGRFVDINRGRKTFDGVFGSFED